MNLTKLSAYHGNAAIKAKYIARMKAHIAADELIQGTGFENGKGCAVGCTLDNYDHGRYPIELDAPEVLAYLQDAIFEGLPSDEAKAFPLAFLEAIKEGADLSLVWPKYAVWLLSDPIHGTFQYCNESGKAATMQVVALYNRVIEGGSVGEDEWARAREAAIQARAAREAREAGETRAREAGEVWAAEEAAWAARSAAMAAGEAEWAAREAGEAAMAAAGAARAREVAIQARAAGEVWAAWEARAAGEAWIDSYRAQRDKLLELLAGAN